MLLKLVVVVVLSSGVLATRWVLASDDLPSYAKPDGFREVAHRVECYGGTSDCSTFAGRACLADCWHDWLYLSSARTYADVVDGLVERYESSGWRMHGCGGPDTAVTAENRCFVVIKGNYEECLSYHDFKRETYVGLEEWRQKHIDRIDDAVGAVLVSDGCA